jgi:methionyl-tRNA formyltransferase
MRILFAGTPAIAVPSLRILRSRHEICALLTGADQQAGRGRKHEPSPAKRAAAELGVRIIEAEKLDVKVHAEIRSLRPELLTVVAYGKIFRKGFLDLFPRGGINLHPSLLPRYRGPSPITAAILSGDAETGVTIQKIALTVDSGDILSQERIALRGDETTGALSERLAVLGADLLIDVVGRLEKGGIEGTPQREQEATYCRLVRKEDGLIDWKLSAAQIERMTRAYDPWPRSSTTWGVNALSLLKSSVYTGTLSRFSRFPDTEGANPGQVIGSHPGLGLLVRTGQGILAVERLQLQYKKALDWRSFLNGHPEVIGTRFGG